MTCLQIPQTEAGLLQLRISPGLLTSWGLVTFSMFIYMYIYRQHKFHRQTTSLVILYQLHFICVASCSCRVNILTFAALYATSLVGHDQQKLCMRAGTAWPASCS